MSEVTQETPPLAQPSLSRGRPAWVAGLKAYEKPSLRKVAIQIVDTVVPYLGLLALMVLTMRWGLPYWVTLLLAIPAGALLVRIFIFFHDCTHGSYVAQPWGLRLLGTIFGVMTFTPYDEWRHSHGVHHTTAGNLDRRGIGDVWTMTADEYTASSPLRRLGYRLFRNPLVMFGLGPLFVFVLSYRLPSRGASRQQLLSTLITDAALIGILVACWLTIGLKTYFLIQMPVMALGGAAGVWLFYVQHQFDPSYWERTADWSSTEAAMQGSSYYKLPRLLQWISGNIGFHHIHHLRPRIPNYNLQRALDETPELQLRDPLLLGASFRSVRLKLWDEKRKLLLTFAEMSRRLRAPARG
jgi:acyl-lipid omega-6 desaturase (Delta-12 desaturase)